MRCSEVYFCLLALLWLYFYFFTICGKDISDYQFTIPTEVAKLIIDEVNAHLSEISYSTAKEQKHENVEVIMESDENNENTSQDIPAGMLEFFMGQGT